MATALLPSLALAALALLAPQDPPGAPAERPCRIHGRVVDADGVPVPGARVVAKGWPGNQGRVEAFGVPGQWQDPETVTGADGAFELRFVPPQAFQFAVSVRHDDYADLGWRWSGIAFGEERAQGVVMLERPGVIEGHLTSAGGDLLADGWFVEARSATGLAHHDGISTQHCAIDRETGGFRFDRFPPGLVSLQAWRQSGERSEEVTVATNATGRVHVALVYDGPDLARRILLEISSRGPTAAATSQLAAGALRAVAADGTVFPLERIANRGWEHWSRGLPPGEYRVEIDDPRFVRWEQPGVRPGTTVHATLEGRARLALTVLAPDGEPVRRYRLRLQQRSPRQYTPFFELQAADVPPPADGVFRGLLEGSYDVRISAAGYGEHRGTLDGLRADETVELLVRLAPKRAVRGRVMHDDGTPAATGRVELTLGELAGHDGDPGSTRFTTVGAGREEREEIIPYRDAVATLDADGAFDLGEVAAGPAILRVRIGEWIRHDVAVGSESALDLVVTLPALGSVSGQVSFAGPRPEDAIHLWPRHAPYESQVAAREELDGSDPVDAEGRYRLGPLLAGSQELELIVVRDFDDESFSTRSLARVRVDVRPGAPTPYDIDLGFTRPTSNLVFWVLLAGEPSAEGLTLRLTPREPYDAKGREHEHVEVGVRGVWPVHSAAGVGVYDVTVSRASLWSYTFPEPLDVRVGQEGLAAPAFTFDVPVVRRDLCVLGTDGAALASSGVWIGPAAGKVHGTVLTTTATGELPLVLPCGRYAVHLGAPAALGTTGPLTTEFDWCGGEDQLVVRLPPR
jgi:hypothetical protein